MNYLIICHDTSAEMAPIITWLANDPENTVLLATDRGRDDFSPKGARKIILRKADFRVARESVPEYLGCFMRRAEKTAWSLKMLAESGNQPDIILTLSSGGLGFCLPDLFPSAFLVNYLEDMSSWSRIEAKARKLMQTMQVIQGDLAYAFGKKARAGMAADLKKPIGLAPLSVDTDFFRPRDDSGRRPCVLFCMRGTPLERYPAIIRAALRLAASRRELEIAISAPPHLDPRLFMKEYAERIRIFRSPTILERRELYWAASIVVCPEFGQEALEAMSSSKPVLTPDACPACLKLPENRLAEYLVQILDDEKLLAKSARESRIMAMENYDFKKLVPRHVADIGEALKRGGNADTVEI